MPRAGASRLRTLAILVGVGLGIVGLTYVIDGGGDGFTEVTITGDTSGARPEVGKAPPGFKTIDVDGAPFDLASLAGKPVWLTFGASWCVDCRAEAPDLIATAEKYRAAGLTVVGVFIDEDADAVRRYAERVGMDIVLIPDPSTTLAGRYRIMGLPTHYFVTADGLIQEIRLGGLPPAEMDRLAVSIVE